ncbi:hypothetical protein Taro_012446 [Colocasia esculenta]|uniref:SANT domain-containing protein n=1 Tax=Colocasia esculenta TaxID=4460 RepID=A0A843U411_COLES|nr:hypothetical protein [Colocasia esculenta]
MDLLKLYHDEDSIADTSSDHLSTDSPDTSDIYEEKPIPPRIGDEYQVELPPLERKSECHGPVWSSVFMNTVYSSVRIGLDIPVVWALEWHERKSCGAMAGGAETAGMVPPVILEKTHERKFQSSANGRDAENEKADGKCSKSMAHKDELLNQLPEFNKNYSPVPGVPVTTWTEDEEKIFLLGLYIFGKNLVQVRRFMECKKMGDILSFYYGSFYRSDVHRRWSECRKMRSRKCIFGQRIFSGWRQNELLQRLDASLSEAGRSALLEATKALSEGRNSLEEFASTLKTTVGIKVLVEAVGIGIEHYDLTGVVSDPSRTNQSISIRAEIPVGKACSSLSTGDIIKFLTGDFRLSKARSNDLFWEAVWPRLLATGWHSEQPKNDGFSTSRHALVFLMPGVKKFSRKLVKGKHYFDSVSDVLYKVASDPRLLELEVEGPKGGSSIKDEYRQDANNTMDQNGTSDRQQHSYPCPRLSICNSELMKFTVVDTSLVQGEPPYRVREQRSLPVDNTFGYGPSSPGEAESASSEDQPSSTEILTDRDSDPNLSDDRKFENDKSSVNKVAKPILSDHVQSVSKIRMPTNRQNSNGQYPLMLSNMDPVKDINCQFTPRVKRKPNYLSPISKRQRLSACRCSVSGDHDFSYSLGNFVKEENFLSKAVKSSETVVTEAGQSLGKVSTDLSAKGIPSESNEHISSGNCFNACSVGDVKLPSEKLHPRDLIDLNVPQFPPDFDACETFNAEVADNQDDLSLKLSSRPSERQQNLADPQPWENSNGLSVEQHPTVNARRQSTRNRPLTTKALEALASGFLTTKRRGKGTKPLSSGKVASRPSRHSCKPADTSVSMTTADHDNTICELVDAKSEPMDEECSSNTNLP